MRPRKVGNVDEMRRYRVDEDAEIGDGLDVPLEDLALLELFMMPSLLLRLRSMRTLWLTTTFSFGWLTLATLKSIIFRVLVEITDRRMSICGRTHRCPSGPRPGRP